MNETSKVELHETQDEKTERYVIHIDNFDGPLDLLWDLILKAKIDVTEIFVSHITEQYIDYLKLMEKMNIKIASEFVTMASDLLYYKSKALLPGEDIEDEYFIPPLPSDLVQKLLEYKRYQITSGKLRDRYEKQSAHFYRQNVITDAIEEEFVGASLFDLLKAFAYILESEESVEQEEIVFDEVLVSDKIEFISGLLMEKDQISFRDIFSEKPGRIEIIASFLAILEMTKSKNIRIMQHVLYGEIIIVRAK